ncbi:MAG: hypothetical protein Q7T10_15630 [Rhodoferax sp.]|uniref:hypothetical protein n=1 Tax=Rhodoferax sp. TaxID=50421 RepID=UPI00272281E2|nr:hypothetical protein [Rhodoferax sp.]MDO8450227.1 hypothetical protein [Rhodoferax sp.]
MSTLQAELDRLYLSHERNIQNPHGAEPGLIASDGTVRAMVLELARPADWTLLSILWRGVQTDLELPAPAIAVSGIDGYQLWFSLAEPTSVAQARAFLEFLRLRYLNLVAPGRISMMPSVDAAMPGKIHHALLVPALQPATGRWSAFIAPDLAAIFSEEPWLDLPPNPDAQAKVLARLECIKPAVFHAALERLSPVVVRTETSPMTSVAVERGGSQANQEVNASDLHGNSPDPKVFLLGVMNDKTIELHLRIEAAKALLPYFEGRVGS